MLTPRDLLFGKQLRVEDLSSERAATTAEYAMIAGVLGVVAVAILARLRRRRAAAS
ncbi:MAG: hypothetical protein AAF437_10270 [Pseudomonadota bacterium]